MWETSQLHFKVSGVQPLERHEFDQKHAFSYTERTYFMQIARCTNFDQFFHWFVSLALVVTEFECF